jgi:hypothetical protein
LKSFSTTSLTEELENEDKIKELENLLEAQKYRIEKQNQRIIELEGVKENENQISSMDNTGLIIEEDDEQKWSVEDSKNDDETIAKEKSLDGCILEEEENTDENQK